MKDHTDRSTLDMGKFVRQSFLLSDFVNKTAHKNGKRVIVSLKGKDMQTLANTNDRYYVYFWNATCSGEITHIEKLDSLDRAGENVLIASITSSYYGIPGWLDKTTFAKYPFYIIEDEQYSDIILLREVRFIQEACSSCYKQYKDELIWTSYLLIENGSIKPIFSNDTTYVLK